MKAKREQILSQPLHISNHHLYDLHQSSTSHQNEYEQYLRR